MQEKTVQSYRLSPQQKRLWLLQQKHPGPYRVQCSWLLDGSLDRAKLQTAMDVIVERHEILRTTFQNLPDVLRQGQVICQATPLAWSEWYLTGLSEAAQQEKLEQIFREADELPLNLTHGSLLDCTIIKLGPNRHILNINLPALCADRRSLRNLLSEFSLAYASATELTDEPMQYADYAAWRHELLNSEETKAGREYWRQLDLPALNTQRLPLEQRSTVTEFNPHWIDLTVAPERVAQIEARAREHDCDLSTFLLACYQVLLGRLSGQMRIVVGALFDGRKYEELQSAIGLFASYLPVSSQLDSDKSFATVLATLKETIEAACLWQEYFSWDDNEAGSFPFAFEYVEGGASSFSAGGLSVSRLKESVQFDNSRIRLSIERVGDELHAEFHYDASLFSAHDIDRISRRFDTLLTSVCENTELPLSELSIVPLSEERQLLHDFNNTLVGEFSQQCLHELVAAQAQLTPDAPAVLSDNENLTYRELNERANQLAHHLRELGVGPDHLVGICIERSATMVVGLLGILAAGGAYVPLDPEYPEERLAFMIEDARLSVIVTTKDLLDRLPAVEGHIVCLDRDAELIRTQSKESAASNVTLENLAYVIYTSGSTGRPKGVMISHRSINNRLLWMQRVFPLEPSDRVLQKTVFSFDASVWELFLPLITGAQVFMAQPGGHKDSAYLVATVADQQITVLQLVPSMLQVLIEEPGLSRWQGLKRLFCGGEVLPIELQKRFFQLVDAELINLYGPTEVSIDATSWICERNSNHAGVVIGRPIANTQVYVLDERLRLAPIGVAGELFVSGVGLARGYHRRPDLTVERFLPNPFSAEAGQRLYRTGDLARYHEDGAIEYLGRADHQVKLRGFRVELGELEAVLLEHQAVREAAVTIGPDASGNQRLVAYVAPKNGNGSSHLNEQDLLKGIEQEELGNGHRKARIDLSTESLRSHIAARVPPYLVPSAIVVLDRMPQLPNGKVDRRGLPAPEAILSEIKSTYIAPRTPVEEVIARIWEDVLGLTQISVTANFFELGGHSLLATQVASRLREALGCEMPLRRLFELPTIVELAAAVEQEKKIGSSPALLSPIETVDRAGELSLSFSQERLWFLQQMEPASSAYNLFTGIRLHGRLNVAALERTLQEIVRRHEILRTTFETVDGRPRQRINPTFTFSLPVTDLSAREDDERAAEAERIVTDTSRSPFDLVRGPLLRAELLKLGDEEHMLLFSMHHIISDGWSNTVLVREVTTLYEAFDAGHSSPLPELSVQYADYAMWQRDWLQGEVLEDHLAYWRQQLAGAPPLELPTDKPRPPVQTFNGAAIPFALSKDLSEALGALSRRTGTTLYMTLLAAFALLLSRYSGQTDVVLGGDTANRTRVETEGLIGFFVNMLVLRIPLEGNPRFTELLRRVREITLAAYAHQELPFERLVEEHATRELSRNPLFQVLFTLQNASRYQLEAPGLRLEPVPAKGRPAKFDLTLLMSESKEGLSGVFEYNTDLFDQTTVQRMAGHFEALLTALVDDPQQRVSALRLMTGDERRRLLSDWAETRRNALDVECAHEMFERQAAALPEATAVQCGSTTLTYGELNLRSTQLANYLRSIGVGPDVPIALCLDRSPAMVIGVLGVLKAGGAYVPLDPGDPLERISMILEETKTPVVLTESLFAERLPSYWGQVLCLDSDWDNVAACGPYAGNSAQAENLAYVIYTSGSTGRPKGVMVTHRGLVNYLSWATEAYRVAEGRGAPVHSPLSFDLTVTSLLSPLCVGRTVTLLADEIAGVGLAESLRSESGYSLIKITPAHLALLANSIPDNATDWANAIVIGGELLTAEALTPWRSKLPRTRLINEYGPTETVVGCCVYEVTAESVLGNGGVPIGRPITNMKQYVLDEGFEPSPIGVAGELYIGGFGLARGYLERPDLTAASFVPDPFSNEPGARLYRTGDLARYLPDGNFDFLGRRDQQVKLRGYRIELEEVESILARHPAVRELVVTVREDVPGDKRLVAYIVAHDEQVCSASELRDYLKDRLPDYMTPSSFVFLEALPLTANGKIDRRALPAPDGARPEGKTEYVAPRTPLEEVLAGVWAELLSLERVGVHDNFFALGGHSLLVTQLLARLLTMFKTELPLIAVFQFPTVAEFAEAVKSYESKPGQTDRIAAAIRKVQQMSPAEKAALSKRRSAAAKISS
jgi:amino acid adenylation domain-containing protein